MASYGNKARLLSMLTVTALFFLAEIITGYMTNSMALVADSFHMLSDVLSIIIGYLAVVYSDKKSERNTYDWARAEVLGAMANAVFLMALVFTIVVSAIQRIIILEEITQPLLVLGVGVAGLVVNIFGLVIFGGHAHGHHGHDHGDHNHNHNHEHHENSQNHQHEETSQSSAENFVEGAAGQKQIEKSKSKKKTSGQMNMHAVFLHVLGDALGSVVVIISALVIYYAKGEWRFYVDPVMSLVTAIIISFTTIPLLRRTSMILLQNPPQSVNIKIVKQKLSQVPGVLSIHDLHVWQLSGSCSIASVHVIVNNHSEFRGIAQQLKKIFHSFDIHSTTIQPEYQDSRQRKISDSSSPEGTPQHHPTSSTNGEIYETISTSDSECLGDKDSDSQCLLNCVSDECSPRMCCDGIKKRTKSDKDKTNSFANPCYKQHPKRPNDTVLDVTTADCEC